SNLISKYNDTFFGILKKYRRALEIHRTKLKVKRRIEGPSFTENRSPIECSTENRSPIECSTENPKLYRSKTKEI
ncbi:1855_t:CDS:1, partial [Racocetra fulgida]